MSKLSAGRIGWSGRCPIFCHAAVWLFCLLASVYSLYLHLSALWLVNFELPINRCKPG
jgi:hypothetical protein